jgi:hypothetical protein
MERKDIERLKSQMAPVLEGGRNWFGKEVYDNHIKDLLRYFDCDINDPIVKEIFDI